MSRTEPPPAYDKIYEVEPASVEPLNPPRYPAFLHSQRNCTGVRQPDRAPLILSESQAPLHDEALPSKAPLKYEKLAKLYIVFFAAACWVGIIIGLIMGLTHNRTHFALLICLIPFPFLIYGYRGIEERSTKLITPLVVFLILLFLFLVVPLSVGCLYYAITTFPREAKDKIIVILTSLFVLFLLIPWPIHAIGTFIYIRHQIVHSGSLMGA